MPMITLNVICELRNYDNDSTLYEEAAHACIPQIKMHVHADIKATLETVSMDGEWLRMPHARLLQQTKAFA